MVHRILLTYLENASFSELYKATERDDVITIMRILNQHPDYVNKFKTPEGYTPFMVACAKANTQMVKYMLKKGADVSMKSKNNETPFHLAVFFCIMHKVSIILVFANRFVETINFSKHYKNATCIRELYYAGANIDEPGRNNATPLQMAAIFGHVPLIKWLLLKNANLKVRPDPYFLALCQGHLDAANFIANTKTIKSIEYK